MKVKVPHLNKHPTYFFGLAERGGGEEASDVEAGVGILNLLLTRVE